MKPRNYIDDLILDDKLVRRTLYNILFFFIIPIFVGILAWNFLSNTFIGEYVRESTKSVERTASAFTGVSYLLLPLIILARNSMVVIINTITSPLIIVPPLILSSNGIIVGFVVRSAVMVSALSIKLGGGAGLVTSAALLPHGTIEIPAISISATAIYYFVDYIRGIEKNFSRILKRSILLPILMLIFSAVIETFITPIAVAITILIGSM